MQLPSTLVFLPYSNEPGTPTTQRTQNTWPSKVSRFL